MDVKALLLNNLDSIYFGPGLDNGTPVKEFGEIMKETVDVWIQQTLDELSKYPDVYGSVIDVDM